MLNLLFVTLGLAALTEHFGLSLALGAFIAGMLIAETEYKPRWKPTSGPSTTCCWACSSSPSA